MALNEIKKPTIEEVLANTSVAKLKELAKDYYVKGYDHNAGFIHLLSPSYNRFRRWF